MARRMFRKTTKPVRTTLGKLLTLHAALHESGKAGALRDHVLDKEAPVVLPPETVNLIKDFLVGNKLDDAHPDLAAAVQSKDPYHCPVDDPGPGRATL